MTSPGPAAAASAELGLEAAGVDREGVGVPGAFAGATTDDLAASPVVFPAAALGVLSSSRTRDTAITFGSGSDGAVCRPIIKARRNTA
jgi:hypothetical protein